jgi:hypothetical protein
MPKLPDTAVPSYRLHKQSGHAIVTVNGRDFLLGHYGTAQSKEKYDRLITQWIVGGRHIARHDDAISITEVIAAYWDHAQIYYRRPDGTQTGEMPSIRKALGPLRRLYGSLSPGNLARSPLRQFVKR